MTEAGSLVSMFVIGLLGAGHCLGMCGGISAALGMTVEGKKRIWVLLGYNLGRVLSYATAGFLVGLLGYWGAEYLTLSPVLRIVAGILLVLMGFYIANWWRILTAFERVGSVLWKRLQPLANRYLLVRSPGKAIAAGLIWGWLPCGLVYSALAFAATVANPLKGAAMMMAFGMGTVPAVLLGGVFSDALRRLLEKKALQQLMGIALIIFGAWIIWGVWQHNPGAMAGSGHQHH